MLIHQTQFITRPEQFSLVRTRNSKVSRAKKRSLTSSQKHMWCVQSCSSPDLCLFLTAEKYNIEDSYPFCSAGRTKALSAASAAHDPASAWGFGVGVPPPHSLRGPGPPGQNSGPRWMHHLRAPLPRLLTASEAGLKKPLRWLWWVTAERITVLHLKETQGAGRDVNKHSLLGREARSL